MSSKIWDYNSQRQLSSPSVKAIDGQMNRINLRPLALFIFLLCAIFNSRADTLSVVPSGYPIQAIKIPVLGEHHFVDDHFVRTPFIRTYIRNSIGLGEAYDYDAPPLTIAGQPVVGLQGELVFVGLDFEYQYAAKKWLAMWIHFGITGRLGTEGQSLLAQGITTSISFEFGWMFKLHRTENTILSGTIHLLNDNGTVMNLLEYINRVIEDGGPTEENRLVISRPYLRGGGGLRYAWAISKLIGTNFLGDCVYGESVDSRNKNKLYYKFGVSGDINLNNTKNIPMGFALGYIYDTFPSGSDITIDENVQGVALKIAYTGRLDFLLSLDLIRSWYPQRNSDRTLHVALTNINLRYYF
jgi:hypothetical protein